MTIALVVLWISAAPAPAEGAALDYSRDVKPVLARRCYACHGALKRKAGLRLDTAGSIRRGGDSGPAVEPGEAEESLLVEKLSEADPALRMPPEGEPLSAEEIGKVRAWIDAGAAGPTDETPQEDPRRHWSFRPPTRPEVPAVADPDWARNPIDAFLAAEHAKHGLTPRPVADRATLLRRVSLDLIGLAPTPEESRAFLEDASADAYEKAVDRLLASPQFGERWGRHWMDVWRYSDWAGFGAEVRESQPHIWRWRDWIIESLNRDRGYDRMVAEMIAGDELAPDDPETLRATGYLARSWYKFNRNVWLQNTVEHAAKAFLGVTLACARCHDHKYDPIAQQDYYRFRAFFEAEDVRIDRVPGQPDTIKDGVARMVDTHADAPTYLFHRGDEKQPDKDHPLSPGVPAVLGEMPAIEPVALPTTAYYPGLKPFVRAEATASAESAVSGAKAKLDEARKARDRASDEATALAAKLDDLAASAKAAADRAARAVEAAELGWVAALAERESVRARITADDARFANPPDSKRADVLAIVAGHAERLAAHRKAEASLSMARRDLDRARAKASEVPAEAKAKKAVAAAEAKLAEARKALDQAKAADDGKPSTKYATLTPVYPATSTGRRLALAKWMTSPNNPLAARVAVNHVWMRHFGRPLVATVFDFGLNGKRPSHPELLDWLAVEFMERGWSLKALHRLIVTSRAYRMESTGGPDGSGANAAIDPGNVYLWRMNPRRMEAELVRDNVLRVAGALDPAIGGPDLDPASGLASGRRSVYFRHAAEKQMVFLKLFDAANMNACYRRDESVVPQQALALANSPLSLEKARVLARVIDREARDDAAFVASAFERVLSRAPTAEERSACEAYLSAQARRLAEPGGLTAFADGPESPVAPSAEPRLRAREDLVHVLFNHNDFVTIR